METVVSYLDQIDDLSARYVIESLAIKGGDRLVILYDQREGRPDIAGKVRDAAEMSGAEVMIIDLDQIYGEPVPPDEYEAYLQGIKFDQITQIFECMLIHFVPNKSVLFSDRVERGAIVSRSLGAVPFGDSLTGLHTLHGHEPFLSKAEFEAYQAIDMETIRRRAELVAELMRQGKIDIRSGLGTDLHIRLSPRIYPIIRGTGEVAVMAEDFYPEGESGGFWTNLTGGEVFTFPPLVEGVVVFDFIPEYWYGHFDEYTDLKEQVRVSLTIVPNENQAYSEIVNIEVNTVGADVDPKRASGLQKAMSEWLRVGQDDPLHRAVIGEIGIGLVDGEVTYAGVDEKLWETFHMSVGGVPDDKAIARAQAQDTFPFEVARETGGRTY